MTLHFEKMLDCFAARNDDASTVIARSKAAKQSSYCRDGPVDTPRTNVGPA
jgi:hypothetical protein